MDFANRFEKGGFTFVPRKSHNTLSDEIVARYPNLPADYTDFLNHFEELLSDDETAWFNAIEDFNEEAETAFVWNEPEIQSLDVFDDDAAEAESIRRFWDTHIPIALSVRGEYQYLALCLDDEHYGEIVYGVEPEFEETFTVCANFGKLLHLIEDAHNNKYLRHFV